MSDEKIINEGRLYVDEPCVVSMFFGELGWLCQRWQAYLRYLKNDVHKDRKFMIMMNNQFHPLVNDFVNFTVDLPEDFYSLRLETDSFEAPPPGSSAGSLTPPEVYAHLIQYFRQHYNVEKAIEVWPPRGPDFFWIDHKQQMFAKYQRSKPPIVMGKPLICVCPRGRGRSAFRNVPEFVWRELVDELRKDFVVVLCGTPSGSFLANYEGESVINLISYNKDDRFDLVMEYMVNSVCCISSQSGLTHVGLLSNCPSYIIGHERDRHAIVENRFNAPVSFRYVVDYRGIDAKTILEDLSTYFDELIKGGFLTQDGKLIDVKYDDTLSADMETLNNLYGEMYGK